MSDDLERQLADALADGKITDEDAEQVRRMREFLQLAGPPRHPDDHGPGCRSPLDRLRAAGRQDLVDWALGRDR